MTTGRMDANSAVAIQKCLDKICVPSRPCFSSARVGPWSNTRPPCERQRCASGTRYSPGTAAHPPPTSPSPAMLCVSPQLKRDGRRMSQQAAQWEPGRRPAPNTYSKSSPPSQDGKAIRPIRSHRPANSKCHRVHRRIPNRSASDRTQQPYENSRAYRQQGRPPTGAESPRPVRRGRRHSSPDSSRSNLRRPGRTRTHGPPTAAMEVESEVAPAQAACAVPCHMA